MKPARRVLFGSAAVIAAAMLAIQVIPYGRDHANPPVSREPAWSSIATRDLAVIACFDCHSNETRWPWHSNVAPLSWRIQRHVDEGRAELNFSEWGIRDQESEEIVESVQEGAMPPWDYLLLHPEARFSAQEREAFLDGLVATFGSGDDDGDD
jgi:hypothetical protein